MNMETYTYSLLSSALGIIIVFLALVALSILMVLLKRVFDSKKESKSVAPAAELQESMQVKEAEDLEWLTAAVAAYMIAELEASGAPSAERWQPGPEERTDPWVSSPVLRTQV